MFLNIEVDHSIDKVIQDVNASKAKVESAAMKALNKTALWLKVQASKEISQEKQIKQSLIRKRLRIIKASKSSVNALVKASLYGIKVGKLGSMRQTMIGAKVGSRMFQGAFIATMKSGHTGIFKRRGRTSLPIDEILLPLEPEASKIIKELVTQEVEKVFEKFFHRELNYI
ncbi:phage tail protein [Wolbachia endosymbiont of Ctenocephalides felis wCfeT]|uniref:phage tail protein n=1 Tax=Wolbachia endosymbiont of Ctenocephalides felis wCfeT TaxID=2732593 RepID=UPI001444FBF4|nr:phage tail protein [Wolbachia endosymbiont of Ctenocephalides felis wCfeT]